MKIILKYLFGVWFIISALASLQFGLMGAVAGLFLVISALICFPLSLQFIEQKLGTKLLTAVRYISVIFFALFGYSIMSSTEGFKDQQKQIELNKPTQSEAKQLDSDRDSKSELLATKSTNLEELFLNPEALRDEINNVIYLDKKMGDWKNPDGSEWYSITDYNMIGSPHRGVETENTKTINISSATEDRIDRLGVYSYIRNKYNEPESFESWSRTTDEVCKLLKLNLPVEFYTKKSKRKDYTYTKDGFEYVLQNMVHIDKNGYSYAFKINRLGQ